MASTPKMLIPYVDPTFALANFPTDDKAKADRLDVLLYDTGWINLTPISGTGTFRYRSIARIVYIQTNLSGMTSVAGGASGAVLAAGVLPAAYRPTVTGIYGVANLGASAVGLMVVGTDGGISWWNSTTGAGTTLRASASYPQG